MTNKERLDALSESDYQFEIQAFQMNPCRKYLNYEKWLQSTDEEYVVEGKLGIYTDEDGVVTPCHIVGTKEKDGQLLTKIIIHKGFHEFESKSVAPDLVEEQ